MIGLSKNIAVILGLLVVFDAIFGQPILLPQIPTSLTYVGLGVYLIYEGVKPKK
jgi:hypothetical protein